MAGTTHPQARFIYVSNTAWAALKQQATLEGKSVSSLVEYMLTLFFEEPQDISLPERRSLSEEEALHYRTRAVYINSDLWNRLKDWSRGRHKATKSGLIEVLIKKYLGINDKPQQEGMRIKIPDNGFVIDLDQLKRQKGE